MSRVSYIFLISTWLGSLAAVVAKISGKERFSDHDRKSLTPLGDDNGNAAFILPDAQAVQLHCIGLTATPDPAD